MKAWLWIGLCAGLLVAVTPAFSHAQQASMLIFAVVTEAPTNKSRVKAQVLIGNSVEEATLIADEQVQRNIMWGKLEICHSLKAEAIKGTDGYRILSFKMVGASMLPMALQGLVGDCMLRKALEFAPLLD